MFEKLFVVLCGECRNFRPIPNSDYGICQKHNFQGAVKSTDSCSFAELPLPELPQWPCNNEFFSKVRDESEGKIDV